MMLEKDTFAVAACVVGQDLLHFSTAKQQQKGVEPLGKALPEQAGTQ